jgi:FtsP/CotA-like multicopper oxidase with cupredoxin domain
MNSNSFAWQKKIRINRAVRMFLILLNLFLLTGARAAFAQGDLGEEQAQEKIELKKMKSEMEDVKSITNDAIQELNKINTGALTQESKEFHLICRESAIEIFPGTKISCLTYNGRLPGPLIRVREGDAVRVVLHNQMQIPTSLHFHGLNLPSTVDGLPRREGGLVRPGETYTYQFVANVPGVYSYHPQIIHGEQKTKGLYGAIVVEPKEQGKEQGGVDKEFVILVSDVYGIAGDIANVKKVTAKAGVSGHSPLATEKTAAESSSTVKSFIAVSPTKFQATPGDKYVFYLMNGQSAPLIPPIEVSNGMKVRLQLVNAGQTFVPLHLGGHTFESTAPGADLALAQVNHDTLTLSPGSHLSVDFTANNPGVWSFASEIFEQSTNLGKFPGGIACVLRYVDASEK